MQKKILILAAQGFEELELLMPAALWRRAGLQAIIASISSDLNVTGQQNITIQADILLKDENIQEFDMLFIPGGKGYIHISESEMAMKAIDYFVSHKKFVTAICAGPTVLAQAGYLNGKKAVCYPAVKDLLKGAVWTDQKVVYDPPFLTGKGAGASAELAFTAIELLAGSDLALHVKQSAIFN